MVAQRTALVERRDQVDGTPPTRTEVESDVEVLWSANWAPQARPGTRQAPSA